MKKLWLLVATLVLSVVAFWVGQTVNANPDCCAHPSAQGAGWVEVVSAISGSAAVMVAVALAYLGWSQRAREKRSFSRSAKRNIIGELEHLAKASRYISDQAEFANSLLRDIGETVSFVPARPYFEAIKPRIFELPDETINAIYANEGNYLEQVAMLAKPVKDVEEFRARIRHFQSVVIVYLQDLQNAYGSDLSKVLIGAGLANSKGQHYSVAD